MEEAAARFVRRIKRFRNPARRVMPGDRDRGGVGYREPAYSGNLKPVPGRNYRLPVGTRSHRLQAVVAAPLTYPSQKLRWLR